MFPGVLERLRHLVAARGLRGLLFGSAARGEEGPESDLDLLLLADGVRGRQIARQLAEEARTVLRREWGLRVNPIVLSQRAVELRRKRRDPLIVNILREGIDVGAGRHLERERAKTRATPAG
jgi:predicted nucleotidyltransferase